MAGVSAAAVHDAINKMENTMDQVFDAMREPATENQRVKVDKLIGSCDHHRRQLEDMATLVIDQEGGDRIFNEITVSLERFERLQKQNETWVRGPARPAASGDFMSPGRLPPGQLGAASMSPADRGGGLGSPVHSHAASSIPELESAPQQMSSSDLTRKDKRKKEKKEKRQKADGGDAFGFGGEGAEGGASSSAFGAWPSAASGQPPQDGEAPSGSGARWDASGAGGADAAAWGDAPARGSADGGFGGWGDAGGFDAFGAGAASSGWGQAPSDSGFEGGGGAGSAAFDAPAAASSAPASSTFGGFGEAHPPASGTLAEVPEDPLEAALPSARWRDAGGATAPVGSAASVGDAGVAEPPFGGPLGSFGSGRNAGGGQKASLLIRRPFREVEHDRAGFERVFVSEIARAVGVPPHRIRVRAVRPGA